jgi:uncharacterized protein (UPF0276 family)
VQTVNTLHGAGLGLRRALLPALAGCDGAAIDFIEAAPENWLGVGGSLGRRLRALTERLPFACHGLSLSLGGTDPLDETLLRRIRRFLDEHDARLYSDHLSYCSDGGHLYDLLPMAFTEDAVRHVAARIGQAQDLVGRRIAVENVSFYLPLSREMSELEFLLAVLDAADCDLLLDVNNVYVNSVNHGYDARAFIAALPGSRIACMHVAGHYREAPDLLIDTHGAGVIDPVWQLLAHAYTVHGVRPTLLERDFNFPPFAQLLDEVATIRRFQQDATTGPGHGPARQEHQATAGRIRDPDVAPPLPRPMANGSSAGIGAVANTYADATPSGAVPVRA